MVSFPKSEPNPSSSSRNRTLSDDDGTHSDRFGGGSRGKFYFTPAGGIVRTGFVLSRYWNQEPTWFFSLPKNLQAELIADYRLANTKSEDTKKKKKRFQLQNLKRQHARFKRRGTQDGTKG